MSIHDLQKNRIKKKATNERQSVDRTQKPRKSVSSRRQAKTGQSQNRKQGCAPCRRRKDKNNG